VLLKRSEPVRLTYDPQHNVGYICLRKKTEAVRVSDEINIDLAADGGYLVLVDPTRTERTLPLAG